MEEEHIEAFKDGSDLCQQLMDRYANSVAPQHRHLLATAAAMRSILTAESLPLTPPAYFASAISSLDSASASETATVDSTAVSALLSFMAVDLPLVPPAGIVPTKANEALGLLVKVLERVGEGLAVSSVRAAVKCLGILLGFCDLEDWNSVKLGFETLLKFSIDKRPKVRRCAQESLDKVFKSTQSSTVIKEASKLILSTLKSHMPLAIKFLTSRTSDGSKDEKFSKSEQLEVLHVLNVLKLMASCLSAKVIPKVLSEIHKLFSSEFSALTGNILNTIKSIFEASRVEDIVPETESIVVSLASYVLLGGKNPLDTVMCAATLLRRALAILHVGQSSSAIRNLPLVCSSIMGMSLSCLLDVKGQFYHALFKFSWLELCIFYPLFIYICQFLFVVYYMLAMLNLGLLSFEVDTASQASGILKDVLKSHVDPKSLSIKNDLTFDSQSEDTVEGNAIVATCAVFENALAAGDSIPNEHILSVISVLFLQLGEISFTLMRNVVLKLADLMTHASGDEVNAEHLQKCIGSAVFAMGPERFLTLVPISLDEVEFTYSNIWLVPIMKRCVTGASLAYYMEHIMPLAKSFKRASRKVKKSTISQDLLARAHELWGLLPSFCRHSTDTYQKFACLSDVLITFLKKDASMLENVSMALQILVKDNKSVLNPDKSKSNCYPVEDSLLESTMLPAYSKKAATRNIKALTSCSDQLLHILLDLFITEPSGKRLLLKEAIQCLASIADSSVLKEAFMSLLKRFQFIDCEGEVQNMMSHSEALDSDQSVMEKDSRRSLILELASSLVEGAEGDLIEIIYNLTVRSFQATNEGFHHEAYYTLSRILEEHSSVCCSRFREIIDFLLSLRPPSDVSSLRSRFTCFQTLMVHTMKMSLEQEEDAKAFLILNEIILTLKDGNDEARKEAYDVLLGISSSLRDSSFDGSTAPNHKLISMIMGYLSGSSPHIKSGAVSALSVLVYQDTNICLSVSDLVPSLLSLLETKAVEVVKAVLGFVKVMVSSLQAKDLQDFLLDVVAKVIPWSTVSRHHFRSKVTVIIEILMRKCGTAAVKHVTPEKYKGFLKTILENRHGKTSTAEAVTAHTENMLEEPSAQRQERKKLEILNSQEKDPIKHKKRKMPSSDEPLKSASSDELRSPKRTKHSYYKNSIMESDGGKMSKTSKNKGLGNGGKRNGKPMNINYKDKAPFHRHGGASKSPKKMRNKFKR